MKNNSKNHQIKEKTKLKKRNLKNLEKHQLGLNQIIKPIIFFVVSLVLEIISFALFKFYTPSGSTMVLPQYILFDIGVWLFVSALILCTSKNWISNVIFYIAIILEAIVFAVNIILRTGFGYLMTFDMVRLLDETIESMNLTFINWPLIIAATVGALVVIAIPILLDKFLSNKKITIKKTSKSIFCLLFFLITATVGMGCYSAQTLLLKTSATNKEISDDKYLYQNIQINDQAYQKFGSCGFYLRNLANLIFPNNGTKKAEVDKILEEYDSSVVEKNPAASLSGDNLIVIMLESFEWFAIDPYNTPNLWALKTGETNENIEKQATIFTNYNSNNKTNISEDLCLLGFMPNENTLSLKSGSVYSAKYSLPNLFKNDGYTTSFFHNWSKKFYNRYNTNTDLGFSNYYSIDNFVSETKSTTFNFYNLEADFVEQMMENIAPSANDAKFMSFYTTISSHGSYEVENPRFKDYLETYDNNLNNMKTWFSDQGYHYPSGEKMQAYLREYKAAAMDTDAMIGKLFAHLKTHNMLNNTTVVLYADHNAYYHNLTNEIKSTDKSDYSSKESYTVPLMIYTNGRIGTKTVDSYCSPYDLYPTISMLFGLPYNTINAQGKDMFSPTDIAQTVYMSHLTGFYSDKCYSKNMIFYERYEGATDEDIESFKSNVCKLLEKQRVLNIVYKSQRTF